MAKPLRKTEGGIRARIDGLATPDEICRKSNALSCVPAGGLAHSCGVNWAYARTRIDGRQNLKRAKNSTSPGRSGSIVGRGRLAGKVELRATAARAVRVFVQRFIDAVTV
jgi:hypothetical protein